MAPSAGDPSRGRHTGPPLSPAATRILAHPDVTRLVAAGHATDASLEAMARAFLARWPSLEPLPDAAPVVFVDVLRRKDLRTVTRWSTDPLLVAGLVLLDAELEGIAAGSRRGALRETVRAADVPALVAGLRAMGFAADAIAAQGPHRPTLDGRLERGTDHAVVGVAVDDGTLEALSAAQRSLRRASGREVAEQAARVGSILGYPPCCVAAFRDLPDQGDNRLLELLPYIRSTGPVHPLLVRFGAGALLSAHFPCRCDCAASIAAAERSLAHADAGHPGLGAAVLRELSRPVLSLGFGDHVVLAGTWEGDAFAVTAADTPSGDRVALRSGATLRFAADRVVARHGSTETTIPALHPLLVVPGMPLPAAARAVLPPAPTPRTTGAHPRLDLAPFTRWLCAEAPLPLPLGAGWAVAEVLPAGAGPLLVLRSERGATLRVAAEPVREDGRHHSTTATLALSYRPPEPPLPPAIIDAAMGALAAHIEAREAASPPGPAALVTNQEAPRPPRPPSPR